MTSTSFNVGLTDNTRLSSRVLRPPGGGHTDIFGEEAAPVRFKRRGCELAGETIGETVAPTESQIEVLSEAPEPEPAPVKQVPTEPTKIEEKTEILHSASEAPMPVPKQAATEPQKRVRVPPGGFSSGLW